MEKVFDGSVQGIGFESATFTASSANGAEDTSRTLDAPDHASALQVCIDWIVGRVDGGQIAAIGHRIVHGGPRYDESCVVDDAVLQGLRDIIPFDPEHLPAEIELVETLRTVLPDAVHIACFDTAFHHNLPTVARLLPIPRKYEAKGLRRYGFHGLSYTYLMGSLARLAGPEAAHGRVVLAHLGNGASLAAVKDGRVVDTTMGLTPAGGIPMSTRSGDLDPGVATYLAQSESMDAEQFAKMTGFESGLIGISETSSDMKKLLEIEDQDQRAADAVALFCYQAKKTIGAYAAAMGGIDTLVFSGGMGEQAPKIRARICKDLDFLGITIDDKHNRMNDALISADHSRIAVRVIHTDEAVAIAAEMTKLMNNQ